MKYLGIDWGEKRIGLAVGDSSAKLAVPFGVVFSLKEILKITKEEDIEKVIVGEPKRMSGKGNLAEAFNRFVGKLKKNLNVEIELIDERLSSKAADNLMGSKKEKAPRDAVAAMIILQSYFDMKYTKKTN